MSEFTAEIRQALLAPFPEDEIEFLPRGFWDGKARALAYIDARSVMRRLDAVVGPENWSFDYELLSPDGKMVKGKLTVLGVTKCDAGESDTESELLKSSVSDALKRCAVHFGVGRYLHYLPSAWAPFNQQKRQFTETPRLSREGVEKALAICGFYGTAHQQPAQARQRKPEPQQPRQQPQPESRGDARATQQQQAQPSNPQGAFWAQFQDHFGKVTDDERHAVLTQLIGRQIDSCKGWTERHYQAALHKLKEHSETCDGKACAIAAAAILNGTVEKPEQPKSAMRRGA